MRSKAMMLFLITRGCRAAILAAAVLTITVSAVAAGEPFLVHIVDAATGRGVPLVELRSVNQKRCFTDNAGWVAIDEPEFAGEEIFFLAASHGYEVPADGFGFRGVRFTVQPGASKLLKLKRINIAERLYRVTGAGLYDHSIRAGKKTPVAHPLLNARVSGCDSVQCTPFAGKLFWIWGDTGRLSYPLGNFHASGAISELPGQGGLDPDTGIDLGYYTDASGFAKAMAKMPGEGLILPSGLSVVPDAEGADHLVAHYAKIKPPLDVYRRGLCEWDAGTETFRPVADLPDDAALEPVGHSFRHTADGKSWLYFADPLPTMRIPASYEAWKDPAQYEKVSTQEALADPATGKRVKPHRGSITWNPFRKKWIMIFTEEGGTSYLGEVWYAEAGAPEGPWIRCVKVVTHDRYSFYNPKQHPWFAKDGGRIIYFEGTYTATFSGNPDQTPRYEYNQILYRLDLADPRLAPAQDGK